MDGLDVSLGADQVATVEFDRPPHNHFDVELIAALADAYEALDGDPACRAIVLCSAGRHSAPARTSPAPPRPPARRSTCGPCGCSPPPPRSSPRSGRGHRRRPRPRAVGGLPGGESGLAFRGELRAPALPPRLRADRDAARGRWGPGRNRAAVHGSARRGRGGVRARAVRPLAADDGLRAGAHALAGEIAASAPLAVRSIRQTMRGELPSACGRRPSARLNNRPSCSRARTSARAFAPRPSDARPASSGAESSGDAVLSSRLARGRGREPGLG